MLREIFVYKVSWCQWGVETFTQAHRHKLVHTHCTMHYPVLSLSPLATLASLYVSARAATSSGPGPCNSTQTLQCCEVHFGIDDPVVYLFLSALNIEPATLSGGFAMGCAMGNDAGGGGGGSDVRALSLEAMSKAYYIQISSGLVSSAQSWAPAAGAAGRRRWAVRIHFSLGVD